MNIELYAVCRDTCVNTIVDLFSLRDFMIDYGGMSMGEGNDMNNHGNRDITAKEAGLKVKNMIEAVENQMAAGENLSGGSINEKDAKARSINKKIGS